MATNKLLFTYERLRKLQPAPPGKRLILWDKRQPGLALQVTSANTKTFQFRRWDKQRREPKILTLGQYPALSVEEARKIAAQKLSEMNSGIDIVEAANAVRGESSLDTLFSLWLEQHAKPHKKSWEEDVRRYNLYIKGPLGRKTLSWFSTDKIRSWHLSLTKLQKQRAPKGDTISPSTANRALALLSTIFNKMAPEIPNPCKGVIKFKETSRERFLKPEELDKFFNALDDPATPADLRDYLLLSLFTGARRNNVLSMKWDDIDLDLEIWTIPAAESKNNTSMPVPLVPQALNILTRRKTGATCIFVFPSEESKTGHYTTPTQAWRSLLKRAGLKGVRIHDLRRTLGSYMATIGCNTVAIGKALGHKDQKTTEIYARMSLDPIRNGMVDAVNTMMAAKKAPGQISNQSGEDVSNDQ
ncbi:tyrosine-type recombinase/integrase [Desulfosediminicola ganghwensis]|uniref:tyrosine-type recombinase/integrase n=1 Tax=Desulfosediminicola ganghwensis TaxID=2569540 RepID=UPI0010ABD16B|nr:site-specific integrase [Desulfosediminicola ganghwensis]